MKRRLLTILLLTITLWLQAQQNPKNDAEQCSWYVGVKGGGSLGVSTLTSFGADKTRMGYHAGILGGYEFSPLFSAEISASIGKIGLSADNDCWDYWLGADGMRYIASVLGQQGHYYNELYSSVAVQQYGVHINIDALQLFNRNAANRWSVLLSPAIYGIGTRATIKTIAGNSRVSRGDNQFQMGYGGDVGVAYRLTDRLGLRLSSGVVFVAGSHFDGVPASVHSQNYIWNNSLSLTWSFGKRKSSRSSAPITASTTPAVTTTPHDVESPKEKEITVVVQPLVAESKPEPKQEVQIETTMKSELAFPAIYFAFNSIKVASTERSKAREIIELLKRNPSLDIIIKGYTDPVGSEAENQKVAQWRAEAVKLLLVRGGIPASRISCRGIGVDGIQTDNEKARRADIEQNKK